MYKNLILREGRQLQQNQEVPKESQSMSFNSSHISYSWEFESSIHKDHLHCIGSVVETTKTLYNLQKALEWPRDQYYDRWINLRHHVAMKEQGRNLQLLARVGAWVWCLTTCTGNYTGTTFSVDLIIWTSPQGVCVFFFFTPWTCDCLCVSVFNIFLLYCLSMNIDVLEID